LSGIGKTAAASTTAVLAEKFKVTHVLMTGVAGSAQSHIKIGDIVIADKSVQHDMDARPLFPRFEIPSTGIAQFNSHRQTTAQLATACRQYLDGEFESVVHEEDKAAFNIIRPQVHTGLIGSGDLFINCSKKLDFIKAALPELLAVEMEGAAVAQVCHEFGIPFAAMRTISDNADDASALDFNRFIQRIAAVYAFHIIRYLCRNAQLAP
jgi:adenosylhomocysteine nucleosidase